MAEKILKISVVSDIEDSNKAFKSLSASIKNTGTAIKEFKTLTRTIPQVDKDTGAVEYVQQVRHEAELYATTVKKLQNIKIPAAIALGGKPDVSNNARIEETQRAYAKLQQIIKTNNEKAVNSLKDFTSVQKIEYEKGANSLIAIKKRQAVAEQAIFTRLHTELNALRDRALKGEITVHQFQGRKITATINYRRELGFLNKETQHRINLLNRQTLAEKSALQLTRIIAPTSVKQGVGVGINIPRTFTREGITEQEQLTKAIAKTTIAQQRHNKELVKADFHSKHLLVRVGELVVGYRAITFVLDKVNQFFKDIPAAGIAQQAAQAPIFAIFGSEEGARNLQFLQNLAENAGQSLEILETSYARYATSARLAGASQEEVNKSFKDFTEVGTVLHLTQEKMDSLFLALDQSFSKGVVQSEEIKKQLGNVLPGAVEIGAKAVGKTPAAFIKAMERNLIITKEFVPKFAAEYRKILGGFDDSVFTTVKERLQANLLRVNTNYTLLTRALFAEFEEGMNETARATAKTLKLLTDNIKGVIQGVTALSGLLFIYGTNALIAVARTASLSAKLIELKAASEGLAATGVLTSFSRLVGPTGAIAGIIAGITTFTLALNNAEVSYGRFSNLSSQGFESLKTKLAEVSGVSKKTIDDLTYMVQKQGEGSAEAQQQLDKLGQVSEEAKKVQQRLLQVTEQQEKSNSLFITFGDNAVTIMDIFKGFWETFKTGIARFKQDFDGLKTYFTTSFSDIKKYVEDVIISIISALPGLAAGVAAAIRAAIRGNFSTLGEEASNAYQEVSKRTAATLREMDASVDKTILGLFATTGEALVNEFTESGNVLHDYLIQPLSDVGGTIFDKAVQARLAADYKQFVEDQKNVIPSTLTNTDPVKDAVDDTSRKKLNAIIKGILKESETYSALVKSQLNDLDYAYQLHSVSIENFYRKKQKLQLADIANQIANAKEALAAATRFNDPDKALELQERINTLNVEALEVRKKIAREEYSALQDYRNLVETTQAQYATLFGENGVAAAQNFISQYRDTIQRLDIEIAQGGSTAETAKLAREQLTIIQDNVIVTGKILDITNQLTYQQNAYNRELDQANALVAAGLASQFDILLLQDQLNVKRKADLESYILDLEVLRTEGRFTDDQTQQLENYRNELAKLRIEGSLTANHFTNIVGSAFEDSFANLLSGTTSGKEAFKSFAASIVQDINRIIAAEVRSKILAPIIQAGIGVLTSVLGGGGGGALTSIGTQTTNAAISSAFSSYLASAKGNVISSPSLSAHSNTIVDSPTFFKFAKGGVAGEAGPEAILPLKRDSAGNLGVSLASDNSRSSQIVIENLNVTVQDKEDSTTEEQANIIGKVIKAQLQTMIQKELTSSLRPGNQLNPTRAIGAF